MTPEFEIRPMTIEDIEHVVQIERLSFTSPWSRLAFEAEVYNNKFAHYYVAQGNGGVVGYAGMWIIFDEAHITNIAVHPEFRGLKYGKRLTAELMIQAVKLGAKRITLEVRVSNVIAQKLYESMGFASVGIRKKYYTDNNEDALIMWKDLAGDFS
ncbi:MAG: ribosomal protein S18-alanine N-acetyltransferase [Bacillota bacterium]